MLNTMVLKAVKKWSGKCSSLVLLINSDKIIMVKNTDIVYYFHYLKLKASGEGYSSSFPDGSMVPFSIEET